MPGGMHAETPAPPMQPPRLPGADRWPVLSRTSEAGGGALQPIRARPGHPEAIRRRVAPHPRTVPGGASPVHDVPAREPGDGGGGSPPRPAPVSGRHARRGQPHGSMQGLPLPHHGPRGRALGLRTLMPALVLIMISYSTKWRVLKNALSRSASSFDMSAGILNPTEKSGRNG